MNQSWSSAITIQGTSHRSSSRAAPPVFAPSSKKPRQSQIRRVPAHSAPNRTGSMVTAVGRRVRRASWPGARSQRYSAFSSVVCSRTASVVPRSASERRNITPRFISVGFLVQSITAPPEVARQGPQFRAGGSHARRCRGQRSQVLVAAEAFSVLGCRRRRFEGEYLVCNVGKMQEPIRRPPWQQPTPKHGKAQVQESSMMPPAKPVRFTKYAVCPVKVMDAFVESRRYPRSEHGKTGHD